MKLFSHRKGLKPVRTDLQIESMDESLRNRLWDAVSLSYWKLMTVQFLSIADHGTSSEIKFLVQTVWHLYFKKPLDTVPDYWQDAYKTIRNYFFGSPWNEVYDFIEFIANHHPDVQVNTKFINFCNRILEQELSGYRFVGGTITQMTSGEEIAEIERALAVSDSLHPVREHLQRALDRLADKANPDYRNSIKESICAVEALCKLIAGNPKATLGDALKQLEGKVKLHPALKAAFSNLYGYTSDSDGIRHALLSEPALSFEDAKFMLVSCSAFINYVVGKASKAGLKI